MRKKRIKRLIVFVVALIAAAVFMLHLNQIAAGVYEVHGADVSQYQGEIDFIALADQGLDFVFIKATEGSIYVDKCFRQNLEAVQQSSLRFGFYHFFSFDSPAETQAENFIANVPIISKMLPPVIDVEYYGDYFSNPPDVETTRQELKTLIDLLESHYGVKPILYSTQRAYHRYIQDAFSDCKLWIRDVYLPPVCADWTFWQYTDRAKLNGYSGPEKNIDLNVFCGSMEDFEASFCQ